MSETEEPKDERTRAMEAVTLTAANLEIIDKRIHAAECEIGTARSEQAKALDAYEAARRRLDEALPDRAEQIGSHPAQAVEALRHFEDLLDALDAQEVAEGKLVEIEDPEAPMDQAQADAFAVVRAANDRVRELRGRP